MADFFLKKIDHIGIAVSDLKEAVATYERMGLKGSSIETVADMNVRVAFFSVGESRLELLEPISENSVIAKFLKKRGEGIHHVCMEVDDIAQVLKVLKQQNFGLIYEEPRRGSENSLVSFIHPATTHGVLLELRQKKK